MTGVLDGLPPAGTFLKIGADERSRTSTLSRRNLNPLCLPFHHIRVAPYTQAATLDRVAELGREKYIVSMITIIAAIVGLVAPAPAPQAASLTYKPDASGHCKFTAPLTDVVCRQVTITQSPEQTVFSVPLGRSYIVAFRGPGAASMSGPAAIDHIVVNDGRMIPATGTCELAGSDVHCEASTALGDASLDLTSAARQ